MQDPEKIEEDCSFFQKNPISYEQFPKYTYFNGTIVFVKSTQTANGASFAERYCDHFCTVNPGELPVYPD